MANDINIAVVGGNLTRDPELRSTKNGTSVANLGLACNKSKKNEDGSYTDSVSFFDITVWGNFAELVARKLVKGDHVVIQGENEQQRWEDAETGAKRSKVVIIAREVSSPGMFRSKDEETAPAVEAESADPATEAAPAAAAEPKTDDIPF